MIDTEALKRKILDLAIKGKLVPQDSTDEPASELLKRIKNERDRLIDEGKIKGKKDDFSYIFKGEYNCYYEKKSSNQIQKITLPTKWCLISLKFVCSLEKGNFNSGENLKYLDVKTLRSEKEAKIIKSGYIVNPNEKVIIVDGENSGEIFTVSERGYMGSTMRLFVANKYINQEYLDIFLQTLKNTLRKNKKGSAIPHLNPGLFYSFMVPLPPIEEQERIANKVNVILKKLEEIKLINENITKLKDIIKTRIIHLGVNGKLLKSDDNYYSTKITCISSLLDESFYGDGNWVLSDDMEIDSKLKLIQLGNIGDGSYIDKKLKSVKCNYKTNNDCKYIHNGYLLINRLITNRMYVCIFESESDNEYITSVDVCWIKPNKIINLRYLLYIMLSIDIQQQILQKASGSTRKRISKKNLININFKYFEDLKVQQQIVESIEKTLKLLNY